MRVSRPDAAPCPSCATPACLQASAASPDVCATSEQCSALVTVCTHADQEGCGEHRACYPQVLCRLSDGELCNAPAPRTQSSTHPFCDVCKVPAAGRRFTRPPPYPTPAPQPCATVLVFTELLRQRPALQQPSMRCSCSWGSHQCDRLSACAPQTLVLAAKMICHKVQHEAPHGTYPGRKGQLPQRSATLLLWRPGADEARGCHPARGLQAGVSTEPPAYNS